MRPRAGAGTTSCSSSLRTAPISTPRTIAATRPSTRRSARRAATAAAARGSTCTKTRPRCCENWRHPGAPDPARAGCGRTGEAGAPVGAAFRRPVKRSINVTKFVRLVVVIVLLFGSAHAAAAQTADEIIEKHLAAIGGRAALGKLTSRMMAGTFTVSTPAGEFSGPLEIWNQAPNKTRTLINLDLANVGVGKITIDQRFDGVTG